MNEEKRSQFFSPTASIRQIKQGIHKKSIDKKEFLHHKNEFLDALLMQRQYWSLKDIIPPIIYYRNCHYPLIGKI